MATIIKANTEYQYIDTSTADDSVTLTATVGKEYEIRNAGSGGYSLTVNYGSDAFILDDGESGRFSYDGSGWSTQLSTVGGAVVLSSGRKFAEEKQTILSGSAEYVIAQCYNGVLSPFHAIFIVSYSGAYGSEVMIFETSGVDSDDSSSTITIKYLTPDGNWSSVNDRLQSAKIGYDDASLSGINVIVKVDESIDGGELTVQMLANTTISTSSGFYLVDAYEDTGTLPDGSTSATYLEAGTTFTIPETYYQFLPDVAITKKQCKSSKGCG